MFLAACCWGTGFVVAALGVAVDQLWIVYLGYGVIGGTGLGIGYISPVSTLIKWFPDRPGLATGLAIMGSAAARSLPRRSPTCCSTSTDRRPPTPSHPRSSPSASSTSR